MYLLHGEYGIRTTHIEGVPQMYQRVVYATHMTLCKSITIRAANQQAASMKAAFNMAMWEQNCMTLTDETDKIEQFVYT